MFMFSIFLPRICHIRQAFSLARSSRHKRPQFCPQRLQSTISMKPYSYSCEVDAEPLHRYCPGGYHPVHIGDIIGDGRYRIIHKLGFGGYSTVWFVKDQKKDRYVAVKILTSDADTFRELQVLRMISSDGSKALGARHTVQLLDDFQQIGPNGMHTCLVLELLGPNVPTTIDSQFADGRLPVRIAQKVAKQVLLGLAYLHSHGVGHGDLHTANIAFTIPPVDALSEEEVLKIIHAPSIGMVTRADGCQLEPGIPNYLVWPTFFPISKSTTASPIRIIDFGESFISSNKPDTLHTPLVVRAPEVIFEDDWDYRVDLWSMGCMMFELFSGQPPFDSFMITKEGLVHQMIESVGPLPEKWQHKWALMKTDVPMDEEETTLQEWLEETYFAEEKTAEFTQAEIFILGTVIQKMLKLDPSDRCEARDILMEVWFDGEKAPRTASKEDAQ